MQLDNRTRDNLWTLISTPAVWGVHFLFCYFVAAYVCAPNPRIFEPIGGVRVAIALATLPALAFCAFAGIRATREWRAFGGDLPFDAPTAEDRERFLEFSTMLLAALSFVAIVFTALPALLVQDCR